MALSEAQKKANKKWDEKNLKNGSYKMPIELYEKFENYCKINNISKNRLICDLVKEKVEKNDM